jgi:hypothetical protein
MVAGMIHARPFAELLLAAQPAEPVLERLDAPKRAFVIMAIIFIAVIGLLLVMCTMLGARWVRGIARQRPRPTRHESGTRSSRAMNDLDAHTDSTSPRAGPDETIHIDRQMDDTKVDP